MRVEIESNRGIVVLRDESVPPPPEDSKRALRELARSGRIFFLDGEDPVKLALELSVGKKMPEETARELQARGGSFRLDLPTGRLAVVPLERWSEPAAVVDTAPGSHLLQFFERREIDAERYVSERIGLVGREDWRFHTLVDRLGLVGCLPSLAVFATLLVTPWRPFVPVGVACAVLGFLPYLVLKRTARYRSVERKLAEHERAKPHGGLTLMRAESAAGIEGGFLDLA